MRDDVKNAAMSGAGSGAVTGLVGAGLSGASGKAALRMALLGALTGGGISAAGVGTGSKILGEPEEGEVNPYTRRGALGGAVAGGGIGALLGAALAKKYLRVPGAKGVIGHLSKSSPKTSAMLGALGGGGFGAMQAGDEGMQLDFFKNELDAMEKKRRADRIAKQLMDEDL